MSTLSRMQKIQVMDINLGIIYVQQKERVSKATQGGEREEHKREEALRPSRKAWSGASVYQWESQVRTKMTPLDLATRKSLGAKTVQGGSRQTVSKAKETALLAF